MSVDSPNPGSLANTRPTTPKTTANTTPKTSGKKVPRHFKSSSMSVKKSDEQAILLPSTTKSPTQPKSKREVMNDYASMNIIVPTVIKDQEYLSRRETIEAFLRKRDWENMMGARAGEKKAIMITKHATLGHVKNL